MTIPTLQFDFKMNNSNNPVTFTNPVEIITTTNSNNVNLCLEKVNNAIRDGFYVAGFISYEAAYALYDLKQTIENEMPILWFGLFKEPTIKQFHVEENNFSLDEWKMKVSKHTYKERVLKALQFIQKGLTKQINYTVPFETSFKGNSYDYYIQLKRVQQAHFCAYITLDRFDVLSISPELFFSLQDGMITVKPMKGTIHRGKTYEEDLKNRMWLERSMKNKIENDLIVESMYEELKSIAENISINDRHSIEKYPTVYQMTTTIKGNLKPQVNPIKVLTTLFPSGSISGYPKRKTIEIITQLEKEAREVYCGAIGYFTPDGNAIFNVPIRTVTIDKVKSIARYQAGGAITERSCPDEEFKEILTKTKVLSTSRQPFQLLETMLLDNGQIFLKEYHLQRLLESAKYFDFEIKENEIEKQLKKLEKQYPSGNWRIRLLVDYKGEITIKVTLLEATKNHEVILAEEPINKENVFLYHKTTERTMFDKHRQKLSKNDLDVLLWNVHGEITEFTIGNIVVQKNGELITPPVSCGLLPGTFRQYLLDQRKIKEGKILIEELDQVESMWLINSVRKWIKVTIRKQNTF